MAKGFPGPNRGSRANFSKPQTETFSLFYVRFDLKEYQDSGMEQRGKSILHLRRWIGSGSESTDLLNILKKKRITAVSWPCLLGSLFGFVFEGKAWTGHGDGDAICESTGRDLRFHRRNQKGFRKGRRKACGSATSHGMTIALWFREARRRPRVPAGISKNMIPLCFLKSEAWEGFLAD